MYLPYEDHEQIIKDFRDRVKPIQDKILKTGDDRDKKIELTRFYSMELKSLRKSLGSVIKQTGDEGDILTEMWNYINNLMHDCYCDAHLDSNGDENFMTSDEIQKSRYEAAAWDEHYRTEGTMYRFRQI